MLERRPDIDASPAKSSSAQLEYPTPVITDQIVIEDVSIRPDNYEPLPRGTPHPDNDRTGLDLKLVWQGPAKGNDAHLKMRRVYATDRTNQNSYNAAIDYSGEASSYPIFLRSYVAERDTYVPLTKKTRLTCITGLRLTNGGSGYAAPPAVTITGGGGSGATAVAVLDGDKVTALYITNEGTGYTSAPAVSMPGNAAAVALLQPAGAMLVKEQMRAIGDDRLTSLFVQVTRVYKILPGPNLIGGRRANPSWIPERFINFRRETIVKTEVETGETPDIPVGPGSSSTVTPVDTVVADKETITVELDTEDAVVDYDEDNDGQVVTVTDEISEDGRKPTPTATREVKVVTLGGGFFQRITRVIDAIFDRVSYETSKPDTVPEEFRALVPTKTTSHTIEGVAGSPDLAPNELRRVERQINKFVKEVTSTTRDASSIAVLNGKDMSEWGIGTTTKTLVADGAAADSGILVKDSKVIPIGDNKAVKVTVNYPSDLLTIVLKDTDIDKPTGIAIVMERSIVAAGIEGSSDGTIQKEVRGVDKWRSIQIASRVILSTLPPVESVPITHNYSFPDQLISVEVLKALGQSAGGGYSISWDGEVMLKAANGYRGPCSARRVRKYSATRPTTKPVPFKILPSTGTVVIFAGSDAVHFGEDSTTVSTSTRARAITIPALLTPAVSRTGPLFEIPGVTVGTVTIPPVQKGSWRIEIPASDPVAMTPGSEILADTSCEKWSRHGKVWVTEAIYVTVIAPPVLINSYYFVDPDGGNDTGE